MIKYRLICKNCDLNFESWFNSSLEFERLKKKDLLNCHVCESKDIEKTLMAPNLVKSNLKSVDEKKLARFRKKINEYQKFIKSNFEYVGENFTHEARAIHYNEKKSNKGIYGKASKEDVKELAEEGIKTELIPWFKENDN